MVGSIDNFQESLALTEFIPLQGVFPSRDGSGSGDITLGSIRTFAGNFAPGSDAETNGQLLSISQNTALFSLLGTTYGGNGQTTFALPNLQERTPIGAGQGNGLNNYNLGEVAGAADITLSQENLPLALGGDSQPIDNYQPSLPITYIIRTTGNFPSPTGGGSNFIGEIVKFAGNFTPGGYMAAAGQLLSIADNSTLFSLIGTTYGGDGVTTFQLPDLRGRSIVGSSSSTPIGSLVGDTTVALTDDEIPANVGGGGTPFDNEAPGLALTYMIAVQGIFPSRDSGSAPSDQPYLGEIAVFAADFAPRGWARCEGQLLSISLNQALFALLGTMYGGDGRTTFALPDLRDRTAIGASDDVPVGTVLGNNDQPVLSSDIPDLEIAGSAVGETIYGGDGNDQLSGLGGNDTLIGNGGDDSLIGGSGVDTKSGGAGNDKYNVDRAGDVIIETAGGGTADRVYASVSYQLAAGAEVEILNTASNGGTGAINLVGNNFAQTIIGNAGNNIVNGLGGIDTMQGLGGDDRYYVDNSADVVIEAVGGGTDRVLTSVSYSLKSGVEVELLTTTNAAGTDALKLAGNAFANTVIGNAGDNFLNGAAGADTLTGLGGDDIFMFNTALAGGNIDAITDFNFADDTIRLENAIFASIAGTGVLTAAQFAANASGTALDASDRIIYETDTGRLIYDANGSTGGGRYLVATLDAGLAITNADFYIV
jgi:microcystin-dependent protein